MSKLVELNWLIDGVPDKKIPVSQIGIVIYQMSFLDMHRSSEGQAVIKPDLWANKSEQDIVCLKNQVKLQAGPTDWLLDLLSSQNSGDLMNDAVSDDMTKPLQSLNSMENIKES